MCVDKVWRGGVLIRGVDRGRVDKVWRGVCVEEEGVCEGGSLSYGLYVYQYYPYESVSERGG